MVSHAALTVPFYQKRFAESGFDAFNLESLDSISTLPLLTKKDIINAGDELRSSSYLNDPRVRRKTTSGSTGVSLEILVDEEALQYKRACTLRSDEWSGWRRGETIAMIWGNPDYLKKGLRGRIRNTFLDRHYYLDTLKMNQDSMSRFADRLLTKKPSLLFGHAHSVYLFSQFIANYRPGSIKPRGIITSAMILHDWQRKAIETEFNCTVTNRYGCEEVSLIASECERHQGLHVNNDGVYVEIIRDGNSVAAGEPGAIVVTDLKNRAMPLIRYKIGDVASWCQSKLCPCGRGLPLIDRIEGRDADYVTTSRGELISGISLTENFAMMIPGISQIQIIQESLNNFTFRIVKGNNFTDESINILHHYVDKRFGSDTMCHCEFVDQIPQEPSGKYRFCISKVANKFNGSSDKVFNHV